jgi:predicted secreted protein
VKLSYVVLAAVSVAIAAPALADNSSDAAKPPKDKKVCRREPVTGSIVPFRSVCHTRDEWASIDSDNARSVDNTLGNSRPSGGSRP